MLEGTKWLLIAEIENEADGGVSPATLGSALDSVDQGYCPDPDDHLDMGPIGDEIERLIKEHGADKLAEELVDTDDWESHASGDMQDLARRGH